LYVSSEKNKLKEKLENIILELLKNQELLQQEIEECVSDFDYLGAHYNSIALKKVNRKIQTFQNLINPNYDKIVWIERQIENYKSRIEKEREENMISYFLSKINQSESELSKLKNENTEFREQSFNLTWKLLELNKGIISKIDLLLQERNSISIEFTKNMNDLLISIKENHFKILTFGNEYQTEMKNLGFTNSDDNYILEIKDFNNLKVNKVLEINSRIIFDIFYYKNLDNPINLRYE